MISIVQLPSPNAAPAVNPAPAVNARCALPDMESDVAATMPVTTSEALSDSERFAQEKAAAVPPSVFWITADALPESVASSEMTM